MCNYNLNPDLSYNLYKKYFALSNRHIRVKLKNDSIINGKIIGFFHGNEDNNEPYISKWHIIEQSEKIGYDYLGFLVGYIISQNEIERVYFYEDQSEMIF